eukprot:12058112-Alexandrium_andersonii.AAC.1
MLGSKAASTGSRATRPLPCGAMKNSGSVWPPSVAWSGRCCPVPAAAGRSGGLVVRTTAAI